MDFVLVVEGEEGSPSTCGGTQWSVPRWSDREGTCFFLTVSQFVILGSPEDKFWDSYFDTSLGPYARPSETLQETHDFQTSYGMTPRGGKSGSVKGVPKNVEDMKPRYLCEKEDADGQSHWRRRWWLSTSWQPVCLSTSTDRFHKYFRIGRDHFEDIYNKTDHSGEFTLHPLEPMYGELHPGGPIRHGCVQVKKVFPLCLKMTVSFRSLQQVNHSQDWPRTSVSVNPLSTHSTRSF